MQSPHMPSKRNMPRAANVKESGSRVCSGMERVACAVEGLKHEFWSDVLEHTGTLKYGTDFAACVRQTETDTPRGQLIRQ